MMLLLLLLQRTVTMAKVDGTAMMLWTTKILSSLMRHPMLTLSPRSALGCLRFRFLRCMAEIS
jgi:hypothetical protein